MKQNLNFLLISFLAFGILAQEEEMTIEKNIGVLKRETLHESEACPISKAKEREFGLKPPADFDKYIIERYDVPTPPRMDIPGLWPEYDGRVNKLIDLTGQYVPPSSGTSQEIASNFLTLYKQTLLLGDFPNSYSEPEVKDPTRGGLTMVKYNQKYRGVNTAGGVIVTLNVNQNISKVSITREIITNQNKEIITPDIDNERIAVNLAANYLKAKLPHLKRYAVWGREAYVIARNGVPYTFWEIGGDSSCPSASYTFLINTETSQIEEVTATTTGSD